MKNASKITFGHIWDRNSGYGIGWTGWLGTFTCQRCLSVLHGSRESAESNFIYTKMFDIMNKRVPKKDWQICPADKKVRK